MYQKSYLEWSHCQLQNDDGTVLDNDFNFDELLLAITKSDQVYKMVRAFFGLMQATIYIQIIEFFLIFAHNNDALDKKKYNIFLIIRRLLSILCYGFGIMDLMWIYGWDGHGIMHALSNAQQCHNDIVLDATFDDM